jgi:general secretion pathway protein D
VPAQPVPASVKPTASSPATPQAAAAPSQPTKDTRYITIDFDNVDIQVFVRFISEMTGKNFIFDEKVKGKVTVLSPRKITVDEAYRVFLSVLDVNGYAAMPAGDVTKIVPIQQAKEKQTETRTDGKPITPEDRMVTQILSLEHASPDEIKKSWTLSSPDERSGSLRPTGMLIVNDLASNIKKLQEIVAAVDKQGVGEQISYIPMKFATATDIVKALTALFQQQKGVAPVKFVAADRTNAVLFMASENATTRVKELIAMMDKGINKDASLLHIYKLQNASAEDLAKVLMNIPKSTAAARHRPQRARQARPPCPRTCRSPPTRRPTPSSSPLTGRTTSFWNR